MDESYPIVEGDMLKTHIETTTYTLEDERLEPTNHRFGKENDLNQTSMIMLHVNLQVPKKGTILVGNTSSNHWFSGDMLLLRGVVDINEPSHDSNDQLEKNLPGPHFTG